MELKGQFIELRGKGLPGLLVFARGHGFERSAVSHVWRI